ncbi:hypothetical protein [Nitrosopumilus sp.]|uniref:hypothetical protein n=1 Tax=Nitrosopumilus sp. TaxID=2024843 RepID=UPI00292DA095|nr:hypothetical protein [Nitrosopumilus sp.]
MSFENEWIKELQQSPMFSNLTDAIVKFDNLLKQGLEDTGKRTIETEFGENKIFKTEISVSDADVKNSFPNEIPEEDNAYWKRHNEIVDNVLNARKEIILKSIEVAGMTIKGIINPVSVSSSIDISKIIENATKTNS